MAQMILMRAAQLTETSRANARVLEAASGLPLRYVLDERGGAAAGSPADRVGVTRAGCEALGLFCPSDFAWSCGDYGLYLARQRYPDVEHFWLFDYDVRIVGKAPEDFFAHFRAIDLDFLGACFRPAPTDWYWHRHARNRAIPAWRCFFPVLRVSARALDALLAKRARHSRQPTRRVLWPNDESFVATTMAASGLGCADINASGATWYEETSFSYDRVIDGAALPACDRSARLLHPVLFGDELARKRASLARDAVQDRKLSHTVRKAVARANAYLAW